MASKCLFALIQINRWHESKNYGCACFGACQWFAVPVPLLSGLFKVCALALGVLLLCHAAARPADWYRGAGIALFRCAGCHVIDDKGTGARFLKPLPFPKIGLHPQKSDVAYLRDYLSCSHPLMPDPQLSPRDRDDVIAYIRSWRYRVLKRTPDGN